MSDPAHAAKILRDVMNQRQHIYSPTVACISIIITFVLK